MASSPEKASAALAYGLSAFLLFGLQHAVAQPAPELTSLADVNVDADGDRVPDRIGDIVSIRATVTSDPFEAQPAPAYRIYLDDGSGGLMLQTPDTMLLDSVGAGDVVLIGGRIEFLNGSTIIVPDSVEVVGTAPLPEPIDVSVADLVSEIYEGRLIRVSGRLVNAQNVELVDSTGAIRVRARRILLEDAEFRRRLLSGARAEIVGIASQYDPSEPHDGGYRIEMLSSGDLVLKVDYRPYAWGLAILVLIGLFWLRARTATRREAYTRGLLEQVRASEMALKDSEERLRVVADATSDVIWELDLLTRELFWRAGAKELFGADRDKPIPQRTSHLEFIHEDDAARVGQSLTVAIHENREDWSAEYRIVREDGEVRYVSDRARILLNESGVAVRVIGALVDVTDQHLAEQRERELQNNLQHTQRLESLGILSSGIAHDFNNILAAIVGSADLLGESGSLDASERKLIDEITKSCERGVDLTGRMLIYAGRAPTQRKSVDINRLVDDVFGIVGKAAPKSVTLKSELDAGSPTVDGDPAQLQQVVMNFVTNAVESLHDERGEVRVTTTLGDVGAVDGQPIGTEFEPGRYVTLTVTDTGGGISRDEAAKIFEPFYTTKSSGRGLGLSAVVGIVNSHNGSLFVDSVQGNGTTFKVLFPEGTIETREAPATLSDTASAAGEGHVLVADDEEFICNLVAKALAPLDLSTETVEEGNKALRLIRQNRNDYDLLVLDVSMPGLNGDEIFSRVRDEGIDTPVLFISGHGAHELEQRVGGAENVGILAKPFRLEQLRESCLALLAKRTAESQH